MTEKIGEIIRENKFETDNENLEEIKCLICKNIMINASSGPCGCLYCLKCITDYLNGTENVCPGNTNECKQRKLNFTEDILIDRSTNIKILKLIVKCPNKNCDFRDELRKIENHMEICNKRCLLCSVSNIVCNHNTSNHIIDEIVSHSKLLIDSNDNLKNEIETLKINISKLNEELDIIKTEKLTNENTIIEMQANSNQINKEIKLIKNENKTLFKEIKTVRENYNKSQIFAKQLKEELQNLINKHNNQMKSIKSEMINLKKHFQESSNNNFQETFWRQKSNRNHNMLGFGSTPYFTSTKILEPSVSLVDQNFAQFVWKIDHFLKKRDEARLVSNTHFYSKSFYSHGYKMRLRVNFNSCQNGENTHLSVYFSLLEGEYDDTLVWPMERHITIALMDQRNNVVHTNKTYSSNTVAQNFIEVFQKPSFRKENEDYYYGTEAFIHINLIINNAKLYKKDSIVLKCFVE